MPIVTANEFKFTYPGAEESALNGASFEIEKGEVIGIIGPVGAGKTTLCMAIAGLVPRITGGEASGEMTVNCDEADDRSGSQQDENQLVSMVFEDYVGQLTQLTAIDEVKNPLLGQKDISEQEAENQARELLNKVGLDPDELKKRRVWEMSGGQQQRLAIAAALALDPQVLIFDKAIDRLDPRGQEKVRRIIEDLSGEKTLIIVEQDTHLLQEVADRILVVVEGKVVAEGTPEDILRNQDLLSDADATAPTSLQVARAVGLADAPLTLDAFDKAFDQTSDPKRGDSPQSSHNGSSNRNGLAIPPDALANFNNRSKEKSPENRSLKNTSNTSESSSGEMLLRVEQLSYCYPDGTQALEDISMELHAGEVHAIIGNSGAGKTTLILSLAGLLKPNSGKIFVCGENTQERNATDLATQIGTVFQNPDDHITERTVRAEIEFPLRERQHESTGLFSKRKRYDDDHIQTRVSQACELVGIPERLLDQDPVLLPAGLRRLVTIAESLVVGPQIVLLDEPSVGLSATFRSQLKQAIKYLCAQGKAILITENDVDFVAEVADAVTVMDQGQIVLQGTLQAVFAGENWEQLSDLYIHPPHAAQLAQRIGIQAMTVDEAIAKIQSSSQPATQSTAHQTVTQPPTANQ